MLSLESYRRARERKKEWYIQNGYAAQLITSQGGPDGRIDSQIIDKIIEEKLGLGKNRKQSGRKPKPNSKTRKVSVARQAKQ
jgi:hypothetical protein